jgi:hypothetical protein
LAALLPALARLLGLLARLLAALLAALLTTALARLLRLLARPLGRVLVRIVHGERSLNSTLVRTGNARYPGNVPAGAVVRCRATSEPDHFCGWEPSLRQEWGLGLNGFSNGEYQSPHRSQPATMSPSAMMAKIKPIVRTPCSRPFRPAPLYIVARPRTSGKGTSAERDRLDGRRLLPSIAMVLPASGA